MYRTAIPLILLAALAPMGCHRQHHEAEEAAKYLVTSPLRKDTDLTKEYVAQIRAIQHIELRALEKGFGYEQTLLQAFTDVVNQLAMIGNLQKSFALQAQQLDTLLKAVDVSNVLFQSARADYMEVLLTRRDSLEAELELTETRKRRLQATVNVYQALGGGWRSGS